MPARDLHVLTSDSAVEKACREAAAKAGAAVAAVAVHADPAALLADGTVDGVVVVDPGAVAPQSVQEWSLRSAQVELNNFFNNAKVLFLSGTTNYRMASVMAEFTQNLSFADPI